MLECDLMWHDVLHDLSYDATTALKWWRRPPHVDDTTSWRSTFLCLTRWMNEWMNDDDIKLIALRGTLFAA